MLDGIQRSVENTTSTASEDLLVRLNPLLRIRFGAAPECDLLLEGSTVALPEMRYLRLLPSFAEPQSRASTARTIAAALPCSLEHAQRVVGALLDAKILVPEDYAADRMPAVEHWVRRGWLEGLVLHLRTQDLGYQDDRCGDPDGVNDAAFGAILERDDAPEFWKQYPGHAAVELPAPGDAFGDQSLDEVLLRRRSNQRFVVKTMSLQGLATVLGAANEETRRVRREAEAKLAQQPRYLLRSAYTALETYVYAFDVEGLIPGLYHYDVRRHRMVLLRDQIDRREVSTMCIGQGWARGGAISLLITGVWDRYMFRYRHARAYRNLLINCSELAQKYIVLATALGLRTFLTPNILSDVSTQALGLDEYSEGVLYAVSAG